VDLERLEGIAIVGAGPAGLMAATAASERGRPVTVFEAKPSAGRKFLVAGKGGLNLTHSEPLDAMLDRYREARPRLEPFLRAFPPSALRELADGLGQKTWIGSSGRVFPKGALAAPLLRAWIARLRAGGVVFRTRHRWTGFGERGLRFGTPAGEIGVEPRATVLALGGGSWPETGSDAAWVGPLSEAGIAIAPLTPSNAGVEVRWKVPPPAGTVLKNVALSIGGERADGEVTVTSYGLEGTPVYALTPPIRAALATGSAVLSLDLKPSLPPERIAERLARGGKKSLSTKLGGLKIPPAMAKLLRDGDPAARIKSLGLELAGFRPLAEAISSAGGVRFDELDGLMLRRRPGVFVAGEMIDWEAPTGGYLLQASFSTGWAAGRAAAEFMR
jgi:uncharacterized flavoprotein (TIGR03862 family)